MLDSAVVITSTLLVIVLALTSTAYSYEALINRTLGTVNYRVVDNGSESEIRSTIRQSTLMGSRFMIGAPT